jgi:hypothetical protein
MRKRKRLHGSSKHEDFELGAVDAEILFPFP